MKITGMNFLEKNWGMNMNNFEKFFEDLQVNSQLESVSTGDYVGEDGLLYCGKCHTAKQIKVNLKGTIRKFRCICKCEKEKIDIKEKAIKQNDAQLRIQHLKQTGITDQSYLKWTIANDDRKNPRLSDAIIRYCDKWNEIKDNNIGILFFGNVGVGKSFFAACIANELIERGIPVLMTNVTLLISAMSKKFEEKKDEILNQIKNIPLLILDDLGVERDTDFAYEKLQEIIDTRYRSGLPLIITTNLTQKELQNPDDSRYKRVYDRILEMCHLILVPGESRRIGKSSVKRKSATDIIGI